MAVSKKPRSKRTVILIILVVLVVAVGGFLMYNAGVFGGDTCKAWLRKYEKASAIEDYGNLAEAYGKLMELGCEF